MTRTVVRVSVKPDGSEGFPPYLADFGGEGLRPALSADGRFVAFFSFLELVPGDTNIQTDIYVHDRDADQDGIFDEAGATDTDRVSVASDGSQATPYSNYYTDISADGRYVTFASDCNNLVAGDTNGRRDVFVHDRDTDGDGNFDEPGAIATRMVSVAPDGTTPGNEESTVPRMSADGRYISFIGGASNLVADDLNGRWDAFIRDRDVDQDGIMDEPGEVSTVRASIPPGGGEFNVNVTYAHDLSSDGKWFAFEAPDAPSGAAHIQLYAYDVQTGGPAQFIRDLGTVSTIREMAVNGDGSSIVTNMGSAVTLVDRVTTATEAISTSGGSPAPGTGPAISDDARFVAFGSDSQLIPGDTNGQSDVFLRDRNAPPLVLPSAPADVVATAGDGSASLAWTAPDDGGSPIQHYYVTASPPDVAPFYVNAPSLGTPITGLTPGRTYTFTVSAITAVGTGPAETSNLVTPTGTQRFALQVAVSGNGTVQSSPSGIDCKATCSIDFDDGQQVTLEAMPDMGSTFEGWGGACSGSESCQVTMDQARQVTATFEDLPPLFPGFSDDFDGTALDSAKWNTTIATSGVRWCPTTQANHLTVSGVWQDVSSIRCNTALAPAPHGLISVAGGTATLSAGSRATFPYIWRGRPSRSSPFPSTGAFVLEVRMRFPSLAGFGTELNVGDWPNTDPVGDNPPGNSIFSIGACGGCGLVTNLLGTTATVAGPTAFHDYRLEYVNGRYSLWVDGVRTMGPVGSPRRPDSLWVGNPVMTFWGTTDWTDIALDSARVLVQRYPLTVSTDGTGAGVVTSDPAGIDCGSGCQQFDADTEVTLTATPNGASAFSGWTGGGCSGIGTCVVTMDQARNVSATFGDAMRTLTVSRDGNGGGTVTSTPSGIDCGPACSASFDDGTQVTLTPSPLSGSTFNGWSGECVGVGTCTLSMSRARSVTATFTALPHDSVWAWGGNYKGELGYSGCSSACPTPNQVSGPADVIAIAAGDEHSLALDNDGRVWAWGYNFHGQLGYSGCSYPCPTPTQVAGLPDAVAVAAGQGSSLALGVDGNVYAWGNNAYSGCYYPCPVPTQVTGLPGIVAITAGDAHNLALDADGHVWAWGINFEGQLGYSGCSALCSIPHEVDGLTNVVAIAGGGLHSLALDADGHVWAWGDNRTGQLGYSGCSYPNPCPTPTQVAGLAGIVAITAGEYHSLALDADGHVWAWGTNTTGQLGYSGCSYACPTPTQVAGLPRIVAVDAGRGHTSLAIDADGDLWAWGRNHNGHLAFGVCIVCPTPTPVSGLSDVVAVTAGGLHSLAIANAFTQPGETVTADVQAGDPPVSTDVEGDGATPDDPIETQVSSPNGGTVTIEDGPKDVPAPSGFSFFGEQMTITAPRRDQDEPLVLVFVLDASQIPAGQTAGTLAVFRNGSYVLACTGVPGVADPDPCVSDRQTLPDGDAQITVLTSEASDWNLGFPAPVADGGGPYAVRSRGPPSSSTPRAPQESIHSRSCGSQTPHSTTARSPADLRWARRRRRGADAPGHATRPGWLRRRPPPSP